MKKDMTRILVEATIRKTLNRIHQSPEREIRNLIDLGVNFSNGRFQKRFLESSQRMLRNPKSAYYTLVKEAVANIDQERLMTFGINIGYNGCTKGAKTIRSIEANQGFNVPWSLAVSINQEKLEKEPCFYSSVLEQGILLGIHTYLLFVGGQPEKIIGLIKNQPECAFVLFLHGSQITENFIKEMKAVKNCMISVYADENMPAACKKLCNARFLYAVYHFYTDDKNKEKIISGKWLSSVLPSHPLFAFLLAEPECTPETNQEVYKYVLSVREAQEHPLIVMDIKQDILMIDKIISDDVCLAGFGEDGSLRTHEGICKGEEYNIFFHNLKDILQKAMKK